MTSDFAEMLRRLRTARSLTQEELAERAQITAKAVGALERGERRRPFPHTVRSLSDALELDDEARAELVASVPGRGRAPAAAAAGEPGAVGRPIAPVVGRDDAVSALEKVLSAPTRRLVTLTGPGGVGKTTLALLAAERMRSAYPGGVVVVELAGVSGPAGVVPAVATALGVPERHGDGAASLVGVLQGRRLLLVLDNLEHLLAWTSELSALLRACPDLVVLATSRAPVRIRDEHEVRVAPLDQVASAQLFRERLEAAGGTVSEDAGSAVATLCAGADGLPLAVELAASAAAVFGVHGLAQRLTAVPDIGPRDLPARQRSMAATLAWSHELLSGEARSLLSRLSVCVGGFSLSIAEELGAGKPSAVLAALAELLDQSLVVRVEEVEGVERYRLLEPVRQDAATRLSSAGRAEARSGVARAVLETARGLVEDLHGAEQVAAVRLLEADLGNTGVAVEALVVGGEPGAAAELLWRVYWFLAVRGHTRLGRAWAARIEVVATDDLARARVLTAEANLLSVTDPRRACERARQATALAVRAGDDVLAAEAANCASAAGVFAVDLATAEELLAEAEYRVGRVDRPWMTTYLLLASSQIALLSGRAEDSHRRLLEAENNARRVGSVADTGAILTMRGVVAGQRGQDAEAAELLLEAIQAAVLVGNRWTLTYVLDGLAGIAVRLGDPVLGTRLFAVAASYAAEHVVQLEFPTTAPAVRRQLQDARAQLGDAEFEAQWQQGREAELDDILRLAASIRDRART